MKNEIKLSYNVPFQIIESEVKENFDFMIQGIAINATTTGNNHKFLAEELRESANTLTGVPLLIDHKNEISAIKGRVLNGSFNEENQRIDFKAKVVDEEIKNMVRNGLINSVSVGAAVREIEEKGDVLIPRGIVFKELSLVAVPADCGATFTTALLEAYNTIKEEMVKCKECGKMIEKDKMKDHMAKMHKEEKEEESQSTEREISQSMKGGNEMGEEIKAEQVIVETKVEANPMTEVLAMLKTMQEDNKKLSSEIAEIKKAKEAKVKAVFEDEETEVSTIGKYKIVQGLGSLRGASFTIVR